MKLPSHLPSNCSKAWRDARMRKCETPTHTSRKDQCTPCLRSSEYHAYLRLGFIELPVALPDPTAQKRTKETHDPCASPGSNGSQALKRNTPLIQRLRSTRRKHTIRVLLPDPRAHKRSKETHRLIQRLRSARRKHTIRVLLLDPTAHKHSKETHR